MFLTNAVRLKNCLLRDSFSPHHCYTSVQCAFRGQFLRECSCQNEVESDLCADDLNCHGHIFDNRGFTISLLHPISTKWLQLGIWVMILHSLQHLTK